MFCNDIFWALPQSVLENLLSLEFEIVLGVAVVDFEAVGGLVVVVLRILTMAVHMNVIYCDDDDDGGGGGNYYGLDTKMVNLNLMMMFGETNRLKMI
ncbi:unnamed protein product [Ambrosiozyma monospora]|uniref:Unnamed protein product n=1 Tax=Ambrosiozyma monospora TaxID=43982 RepID=A0ACB5SXQ6_AMBMO|nr:unnamed protein product [Ambrosiozyma monospora]